MEAGCCPRSFEGQHLRLLDEEAEDPLTRRLAPDRAASVSSMPVTMKRSRV